MAFYRSKYAEEGSSAGEAIFEKVWLDISREELPVNPVRIADTFGIQIKEKDLPVNISGLIIKHHNMDPIIVVNSNDSENRQRFTIAHELGHYVYKMLHNDEEAEYEYVDYRDENSSNGSDDEEIFANNFAASLLMPGKLVRKYYKKYDKYLLPKYFRVSADAINYRIKSLA